MDQADLLTLDQDQADLLTPDQDQADLLDWDMAPRVRELAKVFPF